MTARGLGSMHEAAARDNRSLRRQSINRVGGHIFAAFTRLFSPER